MGVRGSALRFGARGAAVRGWLAASILPSLAAARRRRPGRGLGSLAHRRAPRRSCRHDAARVRAAASRQARVRRDWCFRSSRERSLRRLRVRYRRCGPRLGPTHPSSPARCRSSSGRSPQRRWRPHRARRRSARLAGRRTSRTCDVRSGTGASRGRADRRHAVDPVVVLILWLLMAALLALAVLTAAIGGGTRSAPPAGVGHLVGRVGCRRRRLEHSRLPRASRRSRCRWDSPCCLPRCSRRSSSPRARSSVPPSGRSPPLARGSGSRRRSSSCSEPPCSRRSPTRAPSGPSS